MWRSLIFGWTLKHYLTFCISFWTCLIFNLIFAEPPPSNQQPLVLVADGNSRVASLAGRRIAQGSSRSPVVSGNNVTASGSVILQALAEETPLSLSLSRAGEGKSQLTPRGTGNKRNSRRNHEPQSRYVSAPRKPKLTFPRCKTTRAK